MPDVKKVSAPEREVMQSIGVKMDRRTIARLRDVERHGGRNTSDLLRYLVNHAWRGLPEGARSSEAE